MTVEPIDPDRRWWLVYGRECDLRGKSPVPVFYLAAALAAKYGDGDPEADDIAALCEWILTEHVPTEAGGCVACGTDIACLAQRQATDPVGAWLRARTAAASALVASDEWQARLRTLEARNARTA